MRAVRNNPLDQERVTEIISDRISRSIELLCFLFSASLSDLIYVVFPRQL